MTQEHDNSNDPLHAKKKAWSGRFSEPVDAFVLRYTASVDFDKRMAMADIDGSLAHAAMLAKVGVITEQDLADIRRGMAQIREEITSGAFEWQLELEDVHLNIEARLTALIGDAGKRLHTGRSRNDQVATDIRLYLRSEIDVIVARLEHLQEVMVHQAKQHAGLIMPGFTHMQVAQPVTFGHHMLAYVEMFERDRERMLDLRRRVNRSPLGAAALAGTTYPIDREYSASLLGFEAVAQNSLDAVSDRDFAIEFCSAAAVLMMHISRLSEELVIWMSQRFAFIKLPDRFTTGSSIMPQKKNPDVPETARGKAGRVYGDLIAMLTLMKGTPLAYNKDFQEDKEPVFDAIDTVKDTLRAFCDMMAGVEPQADAMHHAAQAGYPTATDLADYLSVTARRSVRPMTSSVRRFAPPPNAAVVLKTFRSMCSRASVPRLKRTSTKSSSSKAPSTLATISAAPLPLRLRSRSNAGRRSSPSAPPRLTEPESKDAQGLTGF